MGNLSVDVYREITIPGRRIFPVVFLNLEIIFRGTSPRRIPVKVLTLASSYSVFRTKQCFVGGTFLWFKFDCIFARTFGKFSTGMDLDKLLHRLLHRLQYFCSSVTARLFTVPPHPAYLG